MMYEQLDSRNSREFERILRDGITAVKTDRRRLAQSLLRQAIILNGVDPRPYYWLSEITDDPNEQRDFLEQAVAVDPSFAAARRSLAILNGKLAPAEVLPEGTTVEPLRPEGLQAANLRAFLCPQCGGSTSYSVERQHLTCAYCGFEQVAGNGAGSVDTPGQFADRAEQVLDFVMPTLRGHRWAEAKRSLNCERCGARNLLPPGQQSVHCAYCGSNQMVLSTAAEEIIEPQALLPMRLDSQAATNHVMAWLGRGLFIPDDLLFTLRHLELRPAYYSCWTFDGTLEISWSCEVDEGSGSYDHWVPRSGTEARFFNDVLVPGVHALPSKTFTGLEPFSLTDIVPFKPAYLAGWPALIYDRSLADASLLAREKVSMKMRSDLKSLIEIGREKRNLRFGSSRWSGMTFKHVLLPLWVGTYFYRGKEYQLLVDGHSGKVSGSKPSDRIKMLLAYLSLTLVLALVVFLLFTLGEAYGRLF